MLAKLSSELCTLAAMYLSRQCWIIRECCMMTVLSAVSWPLSCSCLQRWQKSGTHLEHLVSRFCLDSEMALDGMDSSRMLVISPCELSAYTQRWEVPFSWPRDLLPPREPAPSPITASKTWAETAALTEWRCMSPSRRGAGSDGSWMEKLKDFSVPLHCSSWEEIKCASGRPGSKHHWRKRHVRNVWLVEGVSVWGRWEASGEELNQVHLKRFGFRNFAREMNAVMEWKVSVFKHNLSFFSLLCQIFTHFTVFTAAETPGSQFQITNPFFSLIFGVNCPFKSLNFDLSHQAGSSN